MGTRVGPGAQTEEFFRWLQSHGRVRHNLSLSGMAGTVRLPRVSSREADRATDPDREGADR